MTKTICFYEDTSYKRFYPLTLMRPVYLLRTGMVERFLSLAGAFPDADVRFACRNQVQGLVAQSWSQYPVNTLDDLTGNVLFINGRVRDVGNLAELVQSSGAAARYVASTGETVALMLTITNAKEETSPGGFFNAVQRAASDLPAVEVNSTLFRHAWDMIADIKESIRSDFDKLRPMLGASNLSGVHEQAALVNKQEIHIGPDVQIAPGAVIDASHGPVFIGSGTRIEAHAAIYGPCYISDDCLILAGKITGSSIGKGCRVGGEVEESVFHSYVNKYHAGFIGHSYVAPWVNFGAMTTNSDLKNNYSDIRVSLGGEMVDTGLMKLGSLIGDHTKFGIGTLLNTGINIGVCCNIFGGTLITDQEVPSFKWGGSEGYSDYRIDKAIETAKAVAGRRGLELSLLEEQILKVIADGGDDETGVLSFEDR